MLTLAGGAAVLLAEGSLLTGEVLAAGRRTAAKPVNTGYAPDGTAGRIAAFSLRDVRLLDGPFRQNQDRNTAYLLFLDPDRMLRPFRLNYGLASTALPCGGWERPESQIRGHTTGHLLSGLALTYAGAGAPAVRARGDYLVSQLAALQERAGAAGFNQGYLSGFPEEYFDWLEAGKSVWSPYYMIHKYIAGMIDQYQLARQHPGARRGDQARRLGGVANRPAAVLADADGA